MARVCSFDVFDTCLTRRLAVPSSVFHEVARKVFARLELAPSRMLLEDFVAARVNADRIARGKSGREEITLDEIWRVLVSSMGWQPNEALVQCELETEEEMLLPVYPMLQQVAAARRQGCRIIFVSDMYLPKEFIERQLAGHGFFEKGDGIYVSGDVGKTKSSGKLFSHVLAAENVPAAEVSHVGDNQHSDVAIPLKLGIRARLFKEGRLTRAEIALLESNHDASAASRMAGAMRAFRLGCASEKNRDINDLASQFVAPFIVGFAAWTLQQAQKDGVKRLYFMSRDCQLIWKVARELSPQFGGIDCRYLYVSRQALFLPSAGSISPEGMPWMRRSFEEPVLKNLLAKIDLKFEEVEAVLGKLAGGQRESFRLKSENDWSQFWDALNQEPAKSRINELIAARRETARLYFESAGLFDDLPWAITDLGWFLTCQRSLWNLLGVWGWQKQIRGYYLALLSERVSPAKAGRAEALIYERHPDCPAEIEMAGILTHITLVEHVIGCADHPTVQHYEKKPGGKAEAAFAGAVSESMVNFCGELQTEVLRFARQNQALAQSLTDTSACRGLLALLAASFIKHPTKNSALAIGKLSATIDQNGADAVPIVKPLDLRAALRFWLPSRSSFGTENPDCIWPEGSMMITPPHTRRLAKVCQIFSGRARGSWQWLTMRIAVRTRLQRLVNG